MHQNEFLGSFFSYGESYIILHDFRNLLCTLLLILGTVHAILTMDMFDECARDISMTFFFCWIIVYVRTRTPELTITRIIGKT